MSAFLSNIDFSSVKYVGFDMDGTLYDEFDFIIQPYTLISDQFVNNEKVLSNMLLRWIEKGSSYNKIFEETYYSFPLKNSTLSLEEFTENALTIYRNYIPNIKLSNRVVEILNYFKNNYELFLITDGRPKLQIQKFNSLELYNFFDNNVIYTGKYSQDYHKPNIKSLELLDINPKNSVFFGDRTNDEKFALSSGMQFKKVYNMIEV